MVLQNDYSSRGQGRAVAGQTGLLICHEKSLSKSQLIIPIMKICSLPIASFHVVHHNQCSCFPLVQQFITLAFFFFFQQHQVILTSFLIIPTLRAKQGQDPWRILYSAEPVIQMTGGRMQTVTGQEGWSVPQNPSGTSWQNIFGMVLT